jgi:3-methylfumaryl-CoA hydratase
MTARIAGDDARTWIGRSESRADLVTAVPPAALAATLDRAEPFPQPGDALRPLRHWLFFLPLHRRSELGTDGHAERGGFMPPIALPRRMWAGSRVRFAAPLRVGSSVTRVSTIVDVVEKTGRSGPLAFVVVRHEIFAGDKLLVSEEHDIVYREHRVSAAGSAVPSPEAPRHPDLAQTFVADETLLFRYSALTFNTHRIHYDRRYAIEREGYPGLVVHGPLLATLLVDLAADAHPDRLLTEYRFRALAPVFDGAPFTACAKAESSDETALWIVTRDGTIAMEATVAFVVRR